MKKMLCCAALGIALLLSGCGQETEQQPSGAVAGMEISTVLLKGNGGTGSGAEPEAPAEQPLDESARAELAQRYQQHMAQVPPAFITCPVCNGTRRTDRICQSCNGTGEKPVEHPTPFLMTVPCSDCMFTGYEPCDCLLSGQIPNPDYDTQYAAWDAERRDILHQLGYSDEEIDQMDLEAALGMMQIILGQTGVQPSTGTGGIGGGSGQQGPEMCHFCYGTGVCSTCNSRTGQMHNGWTGGYQDCPNCVGGVCSHCGGTGKA